MESFRKGFVDVRYAIFFGQRPDHFGPALWYARPESTRHSLMLVHDWLQAMRDGGLR